MQFLPLSNMNFEDIPTLTVAVGATLPTPHSRHFIHCCVASSVLVVIPSILNLTSSHTRDEVISKNARHVHYAAIGC